MLPEESFNIAKLASPCSPRGGEKNTIYEIVNADKHASVLLKSSVLWSLRTSVNVAVSKQEVCGKETDQHLP